MFSFLSRRWRDLNPRAGYPTYTLSRGTSSASWVHLHKMPTAEVIILQVNNIVKHFLCKIKNSFLRKKKGISFDIPWNCGDRIWTCDLRVMSPTSYRTALLRGSIKLRVGGEGFEPSKLSQQIYSLPPLAARESTHKRKKPMIGLEPITCWLQVSCSANWATSA